MIRFRHRTGLVGLPRDLASYEAGHPVKSIRARHARQDVRLETAGVVSLSSYAIVGRLVEAGL